MLCYILCLHNTAVTVTNSSVFQAHCSVARGSRGCCVLAFEAGSSQQQCAVSCYAVLCFAVLNEQ